MLRPVLLVLALAAAVLVLPLAASPAAPRTLTATVGPGATITLELGSRRAASVPAGVYTVVVRDRSSDHNFRLAGPGVNRSTGVAFTGRKVWRNVRLARGKTYTYLCDPHADHMRGSVRAR
ncbi:MAG: hypothetical protein ICV64_09875 [Thermoleophilia bacterium]|nr:hypothetical protein [Thermoleophilia bacterium]